MSDLDAVTIERELSLRGASLGRPLVVVDRTGSTNEDARRAALEGAPHGATFLADTQLAGRGRGGHSWHSPPGENLYLSVLVRSRFDPRSVSPVPLVVGLAVAAVAERRLAGRASFLPVGLKWPNDVLVGGRKLAGILVEAQVRGEQLSSVVVGIGLNVRTMSFPPELAERATSLALLGCTELDRSVLAVDLLATLGETLSGFEQAHLRPFTAEFARRDWLRGKRLRVGASIGRAAGIDHDGQLLVEEEDGVVRRVVAGEIALLD